MSNTHLKDKRLSLKAIGLLSVVLSLPDDWHYTVNGLVGIVKDGERAVNGALSELKENGYLRIEKLYPNKDGRSKIEYQYIFSETPQDLQNVPLEQDIQNVGLHNVGLQDVGLHNVGLQDVGLQNVGTYKYTNKPNTNNKNTNNKVSKHKYGEYSHVLLTDKEHTHLLDLYGDSLDEHIKILDEYIETSGKKYKNHSLVIQKWVHDEWLKRNKDKPITLDSKFYAEQNTKTDKEVQDEFNRLRAQLFGA
jgi:hypothetical protein